MDTNEIYFEKVSFDEFRETFEKGCKIAPLGMAEMRKIWEAIPLPCRATAGSAGYDFFLPYEIEVLPEYPLTVPTGIRAHMPPGVVLAIVPKSGLGFKYGLRLRNSTGIVDSDYYYSSNEGHIQTKLTTEEPVRLPGGAKFMQGIFLPYLTTANDAASGVRNGGFGSTGV